MIAGVAELLGGPSPSLIGVIHLEALPGAPLHKLSMAEIVARALSDARAWEKGGADAIIVENFGDAPFYPRNVPPETIAAMTIAAGEVRAAIQLPLGINVLRNDGIAALGIAAATGASFIRVNMLTHGWVADQGIIEGIAHDLLRRRRLLAPDVAIAADTMVKHAKPLGPLDPTSVARDMAQRGGADLLIVSGTRTGDETDPAEAKTVAGVAGETPVLIGSGTTPGNVHSLLPYVRGFIANSYCKIDGRIDPDRVGKLADTIHGG